MSLLFAYLSNDFSLVPSAFHQLRNGLRPDVAGESLDWGLGYVQNRQVLLRKKLAEPAPGFDFAPLVADLRSQCIVGLSLSRTDARSGSDIPPYRFRGWLLANAGESSAVAKLQDRVSAALPDYVATSVRGHLPSEVLLHFIMERVRRATNKVSPQLAPQRAAQAVAHAIATVRDWARELNEETPPIQNYVLTNGTILVASCCGAPLHFTTIQGIYDDPLLRTDPLFAGHRPKRVDHPTFRAAVLASSTSSALEAWPAVPDQTVAFVDHQYGVQVRSIEALLASSES